MYRQILVARYMFWKPSERGEHFCVVLKKNEEIFCLAKFQWFSVGLGKTPLLVAHGSGFSILVPYKTSSQRLHCILQRAIFNFTLNLIWEAIFILDGQWKNIFSNIFFSLICRTLCYTNVHCRRVHVGSRTKTNASNIFLCIRGKWREVFVWAILEYFLRPKRMDV